MDIASCLVDTNILLRISRRSDPQYRLVDTALGALATAGTTLHYTHQNIAELWNAMTRPVARNGFGLGVAESEREVKVIEAGMTLLSDGRSRLSRVAQDRRAAESGGGVGIFRLRMPARFARRHAPLKMTVKKGRRKCGH